MTPRDAGKGMVVIDASEMADVIALSGATYTVGREKTTEELAENGAIPLMDELGSQATVFPHCMTDATTPSAETELKAPWPDFDTYYASQSATYFSFGSHTWRSVWTYRRLLCAGTPSSSAVYPGDISMQNWYPGNDYPYGSIYLDKASAAAQAADWQGAHEPRAHRPGREARRGMVLLHEGAPRPHRDMGHAASPRLGGSAQHDGNGLRVWRSFPISAAAAGSSASTTSA